MRRRVLPGISDQPAGADLQVVRGTVQVQAKQVGQVAMIAESVGLQSALEFLVPSGTAAWSPPVAVALPTIGVAVIGALRERPRAASTTIGREPKKSSDF